MSISSACVIAATLYLVVAAAIYSDERHDRSLFITFQALVWALLAEATR